MNTIAGERVYVRLSFMRPKAGQKDHTLQLLDELIAFYAAQPGFVNAYTLTVPGHGGNGGEVGRVTIWKSERDADHVATMSHVLALRADLLRCVDDGSDVERSFLARSGVTPEDAAA